MRPEDMRTITAWFTVLGPLAILAVDLFLVAPLFGYRATITGVVRAWSERSAWPELLYVLGAVLLYYHLFRGWLGGD